MGNMIVVMGKVPKMNDTGAFCSAFDHYRPQLDYDHVENVRPAPRGRTCLGVRFGGPRGAAGRASGRAARWTLAEEMAARPLLVVKSARVAPLPVAGRPALSRRAVSLPPEKRAKGKQLRCLGQPCLAAGRS